MKTFLIVVVGLVLISSGRAQTLEGLPPPNEGVCDSLMDATAGLYGLCIAYCSAQDCSADLEENFPFPICQGGSQQILDTYNTIRGAADPKMPCLPSEDTACPCWTDFELVQLRYPSGDEDEVNLCALDISATFPTGETFVENFDQWLIAGLSLDDAYVVRLTTIEYLDPIVPLETPRCVFTDECQRAGTCSGVFRAVAPITPEELQACEADLARAAAERGLLCEVAPEL